MRLKAHILLALLRMVLPMLVFACGIFTSGLVVTVVQAGDQTAPELYAVKLESNSEKTRFSANLNFAVGYNAYVLTQPYRVVIDIPNAVFNLPPDSGANGKGVITGFRFGQMDNNRSRIVIDVNGPVLIENSYAVRAKDNRPARLIVDLIGTDEKTFAEVHQVDQVANLVAKQQAKNSVGNKDGLIPEELPPISAKGAPHDPIMDLINGKKPIAKKKKRKSYVNIAKKPVIVIDPGHGGIDTGASSRSGLREKTIVLAFAKMLKSNLEFLGRYSVVMTRDNDRFVPLRDRVKIAHQNRGDLFIAIHADAIRHRSVRGTTLYTLSERASDNEAAELAAKENQSDIIGGVDLARESKAITNILIDLAQRETKNHSVYFAKRAISRLKRVTRMAKRPLRSAGFVVLKAPDVPSVLLELGYLSNNHDAALLKSVRWQKKMAKSLAGAIDSYFRARVALQ